jgi:flagellar biosynthesis chaperone FliJ
MLNNRQIKKFRQVEKILLDEKRSEMMVLVKIMKLHASKSESLARIVQYRSEYEKDNVAKLSKTVPALMINMIDFLNKLDITIKDERVNLEKFDREIKEISHRIDILDMKIKAININITNMECNNKIYYENTEAANIEEIATLSKLRRTT